MANPFCGCKTRYARELLRDRSDPSDRSRQPVRYADQQVEKLIVSLKRDKPHWGARKIHELLLRRLSSDFRRRPKAPSTPFSIAKAWLCAWAGRADGQPERLCLGAAHPTTYGAPTSRVSLGAATGNIATRSPSPITLPAHVRSTRICPRRLGF